MTAQRNYTAKQWRHTQYASYFGYITQAIVNNLAPLLFLIFQDVYGIPLEKITLLVTVNFCVQLLVDMVAARFVDKIGYRPCIVAAHLFAAAGLAGLGLLPRLLPDPFVGLLGAVFLYAIGGGLIEVLISPIVEACPTENKASVMSLLHSFYCWGSVGVILLSTLFLQLFGKGSWTVLALLWALLPLANALWFTKVPIAHLTEEGEGLPLGKLLTNKLFWIFAALMFAAGACELSMSQWASAFAESGLGVSKTVGDLAGPCLFAVLMGCARVIYAKFGDRLNLLNTQILSAGLCVVAYLLAALSPNPLLALLGCGLCGLSVGILWPGTISVASRSLPKGGTAMFALLALFGDLGCSGGPTLVGMVSGAFGGELKTGLLFAVVFPVFLIVAALACKRALRKRAPPESPVTGLSIHGGCTPGNSRLWQLAALVFIERIAHGRGGCTPGNSRRSASAVDSRLWQLATARAHREDSTRSRRGMVLNSLRLVFSHLSGGVWRRPAPRPLRKISPPNGGARGLLFFAAFCGVTCGD